MRSSRSALLMLSLLSIVLTSCDPGVHHTKVIHNLSDHHLMVHIYPDAGFGHYYKEDSILIYKYTGPSVYEYGSLGQTFEFEHCSTYADSIVVKVIGNDTLDLNLDLNDRSNWKFFIFNKTFKRGGTCECRVIITNEMIE